MPKRRPAVVCRGVPEASFKVLPAEFTVPVASSSAPERRLRVTPARSSELLIRSARFSGSPPWRKSSHPAGAAVFALPRASNSG
jgi:hypothetical protein